MSRAQTILMHPYRGMALDRWQFALCSLANFSCLDYSLCYSAIIVHVRAYERDIRYLVRYSERSRASGTQCVILSPIIGATIVIVSWYLYLFFKEALRVKATAVLYASLRRHYYVVTAVITSSVIISIALFLFIIWTVSGSKGRKLAVFIFI